MKQILIVDDSPTIRRMVRASLVRFFPSDEFLEAASGLEAIERLAVGRIALIVLDLNMPDMHGLEVLQFVRSHQKYSQVPIIVLTTRGDDTSRSAALTAGASGLKVSGAGGGGFMMIAAEPGARFDVIRALERMGGRFFPFTFVEQGVQSWKTH